MVADMERRLEYYMDLPYRIELIPDEGGWFVSIPDLPGCMSQGETPDEALEMIRDAQREWLTVALRHGDQITEPRSDEGYSGKFVLRLPRSLHRTLSEEAEREGISLNQYATMLLASRTTQVQLERHIEERLQGLHLQCEPYVLPAIKVGSNSAPSDTPKDGTQARRKGRAKTKTSP